MALDIRNCDCMELMSQFPDKHFDLAIVDPPYGLNYSNNPARQKFDKKDWDNTTPKKEYFTELFRVSKHQIVWGGNYFLDLWQTPCQGFIFWYKQNPVDNFSDGEFAWTSFEVPAKCFMYRYYGNQNGKTLQTEQKIHPTQKPIELYKWLLKNYAKEGDTILDTHLGSGSIAIACHDYKFDLTASEIDTGYFEKAMKRINNHVAQTSLF